MEEKKKPRIVGKVADVLSEYEVAINIGSNQGVKVNMEFRILGEKPIDDPDTNKRLGTYNYDKVIVQTVNVYDKYSIASSKVTQYAQTIGGYGITIEPFIATREYPKVRSTEEVDGLLDKNVRRGDIAVENR